MDLSWSCTFRPPPSRLLTRFSSREAAHAMAVLLYALPRRRSQRTTKRESDQMPVENSCRDFLFLPFSIRRHEVVIISVVSGRGPSGAFNGFNIAIKQGAAIPRTHGCERDVGFITPEEDSEFPVAEWGDTS